MTRKSFKDVMREDVGIVFLNKEEFADIHLVDGKQIPVMIDENEIIEREKKMKSNMDGIFVKQKLIYVRPEDFGSAPAIGRAIMLDGKSYRVLDCTDEQGLYSILLEANRSK